MNAADYSWLRACRQLRPDLTQAEFDKLVPEFMRLRRRLVAAKRRGRAS